MIRRLRARHRRTIALLVVVAPLLFLLGLRARREVPAMDRTPLALRPPSGERFEVLAVADDGFGGLPLRTTWMRVAGEPPRLAVKLEALADLAYPDLLVYWARSTEGAEQLPVDAHLLGALGGAWSLVADLPDGPDDGGERLMLYSLARHEIVAMGHAAPFAGAAAGPGR